MNDLEKLTENLMYSVADTLGLDLHVLDTGKVRGAMIRRLNHMGWPYDMDIVVCSDVIDEELAEAGVFARLHNKLYLYLHCQSRGQMNVDTTMYVIDGAVLGLTPSSMTSVGGKTIPGTLSAIKPAVRAVFKFTAKTNTWIPVDVTIPDLDAAPAA